MEAGISAPDAGSGYSGAAVAAAAIMTVLFPVIALIVALELRSSQTDARKRSELRNRAWISGGWAALVVVVLLLLQTITLT